MTRQLSVGGVKIGGGAPVSIQSMTNTKTHDVDGTVNQIKQLASAGCQIVRLAVPDMRAAEALKDIKAASPIPVVADVHFDHRLALAAVLAGADKIRINPGNIGDEGKVREVADACRERGVPIRVGVNAGSLERHLLEKCGGPTAEAMVQSAMEHLELLQKAGFHDVCLSLKASYVPLAFEAYRRVSGLTDCPLHIGVTETGTEGMGTVKSAAGIGGLLLLGIGDTVRVSLTADPVREVLAAKRILKAVGLRRDGVDLIACPTCGRTRVDLISLARQVEERLEGCERDITVAVMGCEVNGPGEARHADVGIACGDGCGVIFKKGEKIRTVPQERLVDALMEQIEG